MSSIINKKTEVDPEEGMTMFLEEETSSAEASSSSSTQPATPPQQSTAISASNLAKIKGKEKPSKPGYDLTEAQVALLARLMEINGQDAYSIEAHTVGKLHRRYWLRLPVGWKIPNINVTNIGNSEVHKAFDLEFLAQVFCLNYDAFDSEEPMIRLKLAMIRMEAVKMGWVQGQKEILLEEPVNDAIDRFFEAIRTIGDDLEKTRTLAFLQPLVAEFVFRTRNHHFLTSQAASFVEAYARVYKSCLIGDLVNFLPPVHLFYNALHWVSPFTARLVVEAQLGRQSMPDGITLRANAAPAGTAIITTTAAVIEAMDASGLIKALTDAKLFDPTPILKAAELIKSDPIRFHKVPTAYSRPVMAKEDKLWLDKISQVAAKFAPIAQGFIDGTLKGAALSNAKALEKHADANPVLRKRAQRYFANLARERVANVVELYKVEIALPE